MATIFFQFVDVLMRTSVLAPISSISFLHPFKLLNATEICERGPSSDRLATNGLLLWYSTVASYWHARESPSCRSVRGTLKIFATRDREETRTTTSEKLVVWRKRREEMTVCISRLSLCRRASFTFSRSRVKTFTFCQRN